MHSIKAIELHFWMATIGIVLYIAAMWIAGVMQGLMWRAVNADGTLTYTFVESVKATYPFYVIRVAGGLLYLGGMIIMAWNVWMTAISGRSVKVAIPAVNACPRLSPRSPFMSDKNQNASAGFTHEKVETNNFLMIVLILLVIAIGGLVEIVPLFFQKSTTEPVKGRAALRSAAADGARHLHS
jgi:heme/copper-type cytochrome/quinol oxidase subunit 1